MANRSISLLALKRRPHMQRLSSIRSEHLPSANAPLTGELFARFYR